MFGFIRVFFFANMMFFGCNLPSVNSLKCISMNNQECTQISDHKLLMLTVKNLYFFPFS